jgi:rsbT antagonist protein RsbS
MQIPVLKQGKFLIASVQSAISDTEWVVLQEQISSMIGVHRITGVILDMTLLDCMDSFACRTLRNLAQATRLRGAETIVAGLQPDVAFAMVQLGLLLRDIKTAIDLESAMEILGHKA